MRATHGRALLDRILCSNPSWDKKIPPNSWTRTTLTRMCTRMADHGNTLYTIMPVRCYGTYSLLCRHMDNLWLEDLSNDHVICSNSSRNQTLYHAWMNVALTQMATWGLKIYRLRHALQFVLGLSVAHVALTHTDIQESDIPQKQYIFQFVLVSHHMSNTCLTHASSQ